MAITVNYGPIGAALGLAQVAGQAQGFNTQAQRDLQALQLQDQRQRTINQQSQSEVQTALAYAQLQQRANEEQQQNAQNQAYRNAQVQMDQQQLNQHQQQFTAEQATREEQAKSLQAQRQQETADRKAKADFLNSLSPEQRNIVMSGGHLPTPQETAAEQRRVDTEATDAAYKKANTLHDQIAILQKQLDPMNDISAEEKAAIAARIKAATQDYTTTIDGINAATGSRRSAPVSHAAPVAAPGNNPAASAPPIPPHWAAAAEQAVGPDVRKQLAWIKANAANLQQQDAQQFQGVQPGGGSFSRDQRGGPLIPSRFFSSDSTAVQG